MKHFFWPVLLALFSVGALAYDLYTYKPHCEAFSGLVALVGVIGCLVYLVRGFMCRRRSTLFLFAPLLVCIGVFALAEQIPFCPECDRVSYEELGILRYWISADWWK